MNVYDFDKTIYDGDSSFDFYLYALRKRPVVVFFLPKLFYGLFLYAFKIVPLSKTKSLIFSFLSEIKDVDKLVEDFWKKNEKKIKSWYLETKDSSDVIISAGPSFLLSPICEKLGVEKLIATEMCKVSGFVFGRNCKGEEKVRRFIENYGDAEIENFFSDSLSDTPLAQISKKAYLVDGDKISPWP